MARQSFQPPKGTRDFYPAELLVRRYITDAWRRVALRHGFDEIDGPTFETAALYKVKSGDAILGEMFGVFSGKDPEDVAAAGRGDPPFVLRPEFTPTLARMYAAKAAQLPKPTKWFCVPNFFRAERQQRGRLREFMQLNVDVLGVSSDESGIAQSDFEVIDVAIGIMAELGLHPTDATIAFNHRGAVLQDFQVNRQIDDEARIQQAFILIDEARKLPRTKFIELAQERLRMSLADADKFAHDFVDVPLKGGIPFAEHADTMLKSSNLEWQWDRLAQIIEASSSSNWFKRNVGIVRGLAYYTGTVFEVIAEGERAVAGGGRYDNLVELFGGPPTPACGFGMGDVVLGNLLTDKGLMPEGKDLLNAVSRPMPVRPDAFVIASNDEAQAHVTPVVAQLRRGTESPEYLAREARKPWDADRYTIPPLHARRSYKSTKNVGKLLADANACHAKFAVILESPEKATLKNLESGNQDTINTKDIGNHIAR